MIEFFSKPLMQDAFLSDIKILYAESKNDPYNLSIPLLAASLSGHKNLYNQILENMIATLESDQMKEKSESYKAWLLGRVLLAAENMNDAKTKESMTLKLKALFTKLISQESVSDPFVAWSIAYYTAVYSNEYPHYRNNITEASKYLALSKTNLPDALWTYVMNLYSIGMIGNSKQNKSFYEEVLTELKNITNKSTVSASLDEIPQSDWRYWAYALVAVSAANMDDEILYKELIEYQVGTQTKAQRGDALLGQLYFNLARRIFETKQEEHQKNVTFEMDTSKAKTFN